MLHNLADILYEEWRGGRGCPVRIADSAELGGFVPRPQEGHANAARWVANDPSFEIVEGWVTKAHGLFVKHSIVRDRGGNLICVTLGPGGETIPYFFAHQSTWCTTPFAELPAQILILNLN